MWRGTAAGCAVGAALAAPEWVPSSWTGEDGPVEWAGFAGFLVGALALLAAARRQPDRRAAVALLLGGLGLLVVAGEEISWGQRLFGLETPVALAEANTQDELTLHNVDGLQQKAVIGQIGLALLGVLAPLLYRDRWARAAVPLFAGYLAYRATRGVAALADWGRQGDQAEAAELLLAGGVAVLALTLLVDTPRRRGRVLAPAAQPG